MSAVNYQNYRNSLSQKNSRESKDKNEILITIIMVGVLILLITSIVGGQSKIMSAQMNMVLICVVMGLLVFKHMDFLKKIIYTTSYIQNKQPANIDDYYYISGNKRIPKYNGNSATIGSNFLNQNGGNSYSYASQSFLNSTNINNNNLSNIQPLQQQWQQQDHISQQNEFLDNKISPQQQNYYNNYQQSEPMNFEEEIIENSINDRQFQDQQQVQRQSKYYQGRIKQDNSQSLKHFKKKNNNNNNRNKSGIHIESPIHQRKVSQNTDISPSIPIKKKSSIANLSTSQVGTTISKTLITNQKKTSIYNDKEIKRWQEVEDENFKKSQKLYFHVSSEESFKNHLDYDVTHTRNKIIQKIFIEQKNNLYKINELLSFFNMYLQDYKDLINNIDGDLQHSNHFFTQQNYNLDDILYDQTYLIKKIEMQQSSGFGLSEQAIQEIHKFKLQMGELLDQRINIYDKQIQRMGENFKLKNIRVHVLTRLGLISRSQPNNRSCYEFQEYIDIGQQKIYPTDNQMQFTNSYHAGNEFENILFNFNKIINALKIEYQDKYSSFIILWDKEDQKKKHSDDISYRQKEEALYDSIYFVKKNPIGSDLQVDIYSNGCQYVTKPKEHNLNCVLFYYGQCVQEKFDQIRNDMSEECDKLININEFKFYFSQIKELSIRLMDNHRYTQSGSNGAGGNNYYYNSTRNINGRSQISYY